MKFKVYSFAVLMLSFYSFSLSAQTVLLNTLPQPPIGQIDSIYLAQATIAPGNGGNGVTWDLSALSTVFEGTATEVDPVGTPYYVNFPTANICSKLILAVSSMTAYVYDRKSASKEETLADSYYGPGTGSDYSLNAETNLQYPFHYMDSLVDTFQKVTQVAKMVTITYDGFGTLITPFATFNNVIRIKKNFAVGDYDYNWYVTSPYLKPVARYTSQNNAYTLAAHNLTTSTKTLNTENNEVQIYPNPVVGTSFIRVHSGSGYSNAYALITDVAGKTVETVTINSELTPLNKKMLAGGMYFYKVYNNGQRIATGKIAVE